MSELVLKFLQAQNYAATTRRAKENWLIAWERFIGKPLEEANPEDVLKLKAMFATCKGRTPLKYSQCLRGYYRWVAQIQPGFRNPSVGVKFSAGVESPHKDSLTKEDMMELVKKAKQEARMPRTWVGSDVVKDGGQLYDLKRFLWYQAMRLGPSYLFRVHELFPYRACHRVIIVDSATYTIKCCEPNCSFQGSYWPDVVITTDPKHEPNEKLLHFRFRTATDRNGKKVDTMAFLRKGRVKRNRESGEVTSEVHWSEPHAIDRDSLHWLKLILVMPPKTTSGADKILERYGREFKLQLKNSWGEPLTLRWHLFAKHSSVTLRKLDNETPDQIGRDADVSPSSLAVYDHVSDTPEEASRQVENVRRFWQP